MAEEESQKVMDGGDEFEDDPFSTDEDKEYVPSDQSSLDFDDEPKNKKSKKSKQTKPNKRNAKSVVSKNEKKKKAARSTKEQKTQLAEIVKHEEIIYNLNHKLHSNSNAMIAAWDRVAKKMGRSGESSVSIGFFVMLCSWFYS